MIDAQASSPRSVTRGERSTSSPRPLPVSIDYFSVSVPNGDHHKIVREWVAFLGITKAEQRSSGMFGYTHSVDLDGCGLIAFGGDHQRGTVLVSISGVGCKRVADFGSVRVWGESVGARVTRLDIAADDHRGAVLDVASAIRAFRDGAFKLSGRPPKARLDYDFDSGDGKTLYVGSREGGKLCRVYEKGKAEGVRESKWVRAEVELHAKDRIIPWDAVTDPVRFLAGSFPFFSFLSLVAERIRTVKRATAVTIEALKRWVRLAAGKSINALAWAYDGDIGAVFDAVRREGMPKRLVHLCAAQERLCAS